jgi:Uma2 family endonuclease
VTEYATVPSIRRYAIVESASRGLLVLHRQNGDDPWTARSLTDDDTLRLPEVDVEVPVAEFYDEMMFSD